MLNWFLIVVAVIVILLILGMSIYLVVFYQSEDDKNQAWFPKFVVVLGLSLACVTVLLIPFDVGNRRDPTSMKTFTRINVEVMWQVVLWMVAIFAVVIIPFTTFYYEAYDPDQYNFVQQLTPALGFTFIGFFLFTILTIVLWLTVGKAQIPYYSYSAPPQCAGVFFTTLVYYEGKTKETLEIRVSIFVYVVAMLAAVGWILFFVYGGVGLAALPIDILKDFMNRPKAISAAEYARECEGTASIAARLITLGKQLIEKQRKKNNNSIRNKINQFKNDVYLLEKSFDRTTIAYKEQGGSPFIVIGTLLLGCITMLLSTVWILHIFIYNTAQASPFLNDMLVELDNAFALLGVIMFGILAYYLLWATVRGCVKVGMRIVFFTIHPMKPHDTLMNSMLFNVGLILLSSIAVVQFCAMSFREYAQNTAVDGLLNVYVRRLKGIGVMIAYMQFFFVAVCILSLFWLILCPRPKAKKKENDSDDD